MPPSSSPGSRRVRLRTAALAIVLAGCLAGGLSGCLVFARRHTDQPIPAGNVAEIKAGMAKQDVTALLGAPHEIIFSNKEHDPLREHAYVYEYTVQAATAIFFVVANFGNLDAKRDRVVVFFDEAGRVQNVASSLRGADASYGFPFGD
jgi:outer membrane protein assembly factor BamE (lipoprotein component of BamABCDE complex)